MKDKKRKIAPKPIHKDSIGNFVLKNYAPASFHFGLHFSRYSKYIFTPVIRQEIRLAEKEDKGHYTVYLPAYDDDFMVTLLRQIPEVTWEVFQFRYQDRNYLSRPDGKNNQHDF